MKQLKTQIEIDAVPAKVWNVLTNFEDYKNWNPFINELSGKVAVGNQIKVVLKQEGTKAMVFKPLVTSFEMGKRFSWKGKLFIGGIFDGEHIFELEPLPTGKTLFTQRENFSGIFIPFLGKMIDGQTRNGFESMNKRLKELAEKS